MNLFFLVLQRPHDSAGEIIISFVFKLGEYDIDG